MDLKRLKWLTVLVPLAFIGILECLRYFWLESILPLWGDNFLALIVMLLGALLFSRVVFSVIGRMRERVVQQARRAEALLNVGRVLNSSLDCDTILQTVIDQAREHLEADHGEILVLKEGEEPKVLYSGLNPETCPVKVKSKLRGLKREVLKANGPLRLDDRTKHPSSVALPPGHPPIGPLLGVPIVVKGRCVADIILTRVPGRKPFTQDDEDTLVTIANQAAVAIENAKLYERVQSIAVLEERDRIAKELHDGLAQTLGYLNIKAKAVEDLVAANRRTEAQAGLKEMREVVKEAYEDVRGAIFDLRATAMPCQDFIPALREYLHEFGLQHGFKTELVLDGYEDHLSPTAEIQLMRIVQEALTNVRKHARASRVWVKLESDDYRSRIIVEDDGQGFVSSQARPVGQPHFGLQTMRERAESVGGSLIVESNPGRGTRVTVEIPRGEMKEG